jgi:OFA family oxalate/formate antiporter-like MFS transporter
MAGEAEMDSPPANAINWQTFQRKRWSIAVAAVVIQLCLGTVYGWSIIKNELVAHHGWDEVGTSATFMLCIGVIGLSAAFGGILVDRKGPRLVATMAGVLFGIGTIIGGLGIATNNLPVLYLGYGLIAGIGNGLGYLTPIATLIRWFPDKRGLVTGLAVMGFGAGAFFMGQFAPGMLATWGAASTVCAWGLVFLVLIVIAAQWLENPLTSQLPITAKSNIGQDEGESFNYGEALHTPQWWLEWGMLLLNITAGIGLISQLSPIASDLYRPLVSSQLAGKDLSQAVDAAGGNVVAMAAVFNGLGRLMWSWLSDSLGRKKVFSIMFSTQAALYIFIPHINDYYIFMAVACYLLSCYGGGFATMPAFAADSFGTKQIGRIYGSMLTAWSAAGILGPFTFAYVKQSTQNFAEALYISSFLLALGFILSRLYKKPSHRSWVHFTDTNKHIASSVRP